MARFRYWARDGAGQMVVGTLEADDERAVAASLSQQGFHPVKIRPHSSFDQLPAFTAWAKRVDRQELLILLRELASLLRAGIPLASSLEGAIQQTKSPALRQALTDITKRVQSGSSLSDAFASHPLVFPELFISMLRVGETAGILDQVLERLAQLGTQELETRSRIRSAMVYPVVLVGFAFLVVNGLLIGVLPKFVGIFESSQVKLPLPTQILLGLSGLLTHYWWLLGLLTFIGIWMARAFYATPTGRWQVDQWFLHLPVMGALYRKITVAQIARTLGSMLRTGVPLLEALNVTEKTVSNVVFQRALQRTRTAVAEGKSLSEPMAASGLFPSLVLQLVSVGERSGQLDNMLGEVSSFYDPEIELSIRNFTTLLEPLLLMGMGLVVGFIALSVLLPIFQLIHVFKR
jgi:type IV pilus assembly protein PilC